MTETHRSFVNRWECDENNHMNVQFYMKRFDEAALVFAALHAVAAPQIAVRHVRYHRELHEGDSAIIHSHPISAGGDNTGTIHIMRNAVTGDICTTAIDGYGKLAAMPGGVDGVSDDELTLALPRGLETGRIEQADTQTLIASGRAIATNYSITTQSDIDKSGRLHCNRIISRFTDGAPHIWDHGGVDTKWLQANNFGRVAVEMKVMPIAPTQIGTALRLFSHVSEINGRTFKIRHELQEIESGKPVALGEVCCLVMSLETRRVVNLPEGFKLS